MTQPDRFKIPADTLAIFPRTVNLVYEQTADGTPIIGVLFDHRDEDLGHYMLWLSAEAAADLAANISGMLDNPETFRAKWEQENRDKRND